MSNYNRVSAINSDGFKSTFGYQNPSLSNTTTETFRANGGNIVSTPEFKNSRPPSNNYSNSMKINPIVYDSRMQDLESKLQTLEQANQILLSRLNANERNFDEQIKELQLRSVEERDNRIKSDKNINLFNDQNILNVNELNSKIEFLNQLIDKTENINKQQRERDTELYKSLIGKLTAKVSETVKQEIEARYKADVNNKIYSQGLTNQFQTELDTLRKDFEDATNKIKYDIQTVSRECSERTHNVSKYIDQQINDAINGKGNSNENLKNFVHKLTDQIKTNLISQNNQNEVFALRFNKIEKNLKDMKEETYIFISKVEERLINKLREVKLYMEANIEKSHDYMNSNLMEFSGKVDKNIQYLSGQLIDTRMRINEKFEKIEMENRSRFKSLVDDMEEVCNRVYQYEDILKKYDEENKELKIKVEKNISDLKSEFDVHIVNERILYTIENNFIQDQVNSLQKNLTEYKEITDKTFEEMKKENQTNFDNINNRINQLVEKLGSIAERNQEIFDDFQKQNDNIEVKQIMFEIESRIDSDIIMDLIQRSKNTEFLFDQQLRDHDENIKKSKNDIQENKNIILEMQNNISRLETALDTSGTKLTEQLDLIQNRARENEFQDGVHKTLERIITNVETIVDRDNLMTLTEGNESNFLKKFEEYEKINQDNKNEFNDLKEKVKKLEEESQNVKKASELEVKFVTNQILNNVEFQNIYDLLKSGTIQSKDKTKSEETSPKIESKEKEEKQDNETIDNKINNALEKIKNENILMWENSVKLTQRVDELGNIREIISNVPPVIYPKTESLRRLLDVDYYENQNPVPIVPDLFSRLKTIYQDDKSVKGNENNNNNEDNNNNNEDKKNNNNDDKNNNEVVIDDNNNEKNENEGDNQAQGNVTNNNDFI